jgi:hypothetical protein
MNTTIATLLGMPLSIITKITSNKLCKIYEMLDFNLVKLEKLYVDSFIRSIDYHNKYYDDIAKEVGNKIKREIKKDRNKLINIITINNANFDTILKEISKEEFKKNIIDAIIKEYKITGENESIARTVILDSLNFYINSFFDLMLEKDAMKVILLEVLNISEVLEILKNINTEMLRKEDFEHIRNTIFGNYYLSNPCSMKDLKSYDEYLKNKFTFLELRGFSPKIQGKEIQMRLEDVYIPLSLVNEEVDNNMVSERYTDTYSDFNHSKKNNNKIDAEDVLSKYENCIILGDPGSGKSTILKHIILDIIKRRNKQHVLKTIIPIYLRVADYSDYYKSTKKNLYEFITDYYDNQYKHIYQLGFEHSNILLLLDGLDEVTDASLRNKVVTQVNDLIARYPFNRYIVTSRIVGYQESRFNKSTFKHYRIVKFNENDIEFFAKQWYISIAKNTDGNFEKAIEEANALFKSISRNSSVKRLATNPLLITIIALIHYKGKKIPNKRVELYDVCTETFLENWVQLRIESDSQLKNKGEVIEIFAPIAFEIHEKMSNGLIEEDILKDYFVKNFKIIHPEAGKVEINKEFQEFIKFLREESGFFYDKGFDENGNKLYGFMHLTFEEYLAAIELMNRWEEGNFALENYVFDSRWTEVIRLAAAELRTKGRVGRAKVSAFINSILSVSDIFNEAYRPLQLVCLIIADDVDVTPEFFDSFIERFIDILGNNINKDIINSFKGLFKELLECENSALFLDRLGRELNSKNDVILKNIVTIYAANTHKDEVENQLSKFFRNKEFNINYFNMFPDLDFGKRAPSGYNEKFQIYLQTMSQKSELEDYWLSVHSFLNNNKLDVFGAIITGLDDNVDKLRTFLDSIVNSTLFDICLKYILDCILGYCNFTKPLNDIKIYTKLKEKYPEHRFFKNIDANISVLSKDVLPEKTMNNISFRGNYLFGNITAREVINFIKVEKGKYGHIYYYWIWNYDFDSIQYFKYFSSDDFNFLLDVENVDYSIPIQLVQMIRSLGSYDLIDEKIRLRAFEYLDKNRALDPTYIRNISFNENWCYYPILNISKYPKYLTEFLIKHSESYLLNKDKIADDIIDKESVMTTFRNTSDAPAILLMEYILFSEIDEKLVDETIKYYRDVEEHNIKKGIFTILYHILNPFKAL